MNDPEGKKIAKVLAPSDSDDYGLETGNVEQLANCTSQKVTKVELEHQTKGTTGHRRG